MTAAVVNGSGSADAGGCHPRIQIVASPDARQVDFSPLREYATKAAPLDPVSLADLQTLLWESATMLSPQAAMTASLPKGPMSFSLVIHVWRFSFNLPGTRPSLALSNVRH